MLWSVIYLIIACGLITYFEVNTIVNTVFHKQYATLYALQQLTQCDCKYQLRHGNLSRTGHE